jgi:hypothetical protein
VVSKNINWDLKSRYVFTNLSYKSIFRVLYRSQVSTFCKFLIARNNFENGTYQLARISSSDFSRYVQPNTTLCINLNMLHKQKTPSLNLTISNQSISTPPHTPVHLHHLRFLIMCRQSRNIPGRHRRQPFTLHHHPRIPFDASMVLLISRLPRLIFKKSCASRDYL